MKLKLGYLIAAAAISTAVGVHAQDKKPERPAPSREEFREKMKNMTPEEREKFVKEWREKQSAGGGEVGERRPDMEQVAKQLGLKPEELRNLTPDERRAKMTEAMDKKIVELNKKKADKTITEEEKKFLERLEARKKYAEQRAKDGQPPRDGKPPGDGKPPKHGEHKDGDHKDKDHKEGHGPKDGPKGPDAKGGDKPAPKK